MGKSAGPPSRKGDAEISDEDIERVGLLNTVASDGIESLNLGQLERLQELVEKKDYTHSKKGQKSKLRLLSKINVAIYEISEGRRGI